jgi:hypothetical protein
VPWGEAYDLDLPLGPTITASPSVYAVLAAGKEFDTPS